MKRIILDSMTLHNWRGEKERTTVFHADAPTFICGDNGLGKSRHFDAFCWLLFGKDSQNRADYELRTYDEQHRPLHHCECSVEATLYIDGEPLTIKREWTEKWVKPRGQVEEEFKGNEAKFTWNGTPVNKTEYTKRVKDVIIDDGLFRMITNPHYFPIIMTWQQQREVLMQIAGTKSDYEIAADNDDFKALLDELSGKSLSDFRKEIAATKKKLKEEADAIPTRIDEVQRNMPESEDWEAISAEIKQKKDDITQIDRQLQDSANRDETKRKERNDINCAIYEAQAEQQEIVRQAKAKAQEECDKANEYRRGIEASLKKHHTELAEANIDMKRNESRISMLKQEIDDYNKQLDELRKVWYEISAMVYDEQSDICPCCGQRLPEDKIAEAREKFAATRKSRLDANNTRGKQLSEQLSKCKAELEKMEAEAELLKRKVETAENGVKTFEASLAATPVEKVKVIDGRNIPRWMAVEVEIQELKKRLASLNESNNATDTEQIAELRDGKQVLQESVEQLQKLLAKREQIEQAHARIAELTARGKDLAQQIADIEKREYTAAQFSKKRVEDCETRINGMFQNVRFKMFDYTQDGNEYETCVPLVNGVPYPVANTAGQVNAGLDIINALCKFYNVSAPIFIDGAESVNHYTDTPSQIIFLQVTNDKQLVIR